MPKTTKANTTTFNLNKENDDDLFNAIKILYENNEQTGYKWLCAMGALNTISEDVLVYQSDKSNPEDEYIKKESYFSLSPTAQDMIKEIFNPSNNGIKSIVKKALKHKNKKSIRKQIKELAQKKGVYDEIKAFVMSDGFQLPIIAGFSTSKTNKQMNNDVPWWESIICPKTHIKKDVPWWESIICPKTNK